MHLKRLEVQGFKSFANRTVLDFEAGVTAVVGPNGCGKSNVVDAIRWTLGEQAPKSLRSREMADVIFNGAEGTPAQNVAESTLVFSNEDKRLPVPHAEVEVTRRLYRSGESEYLINRQPARLRDIRDLFMDTGIGVDAYSFIEQGKVDVLLQANAKDRRSVFEEAAGISRYRAKVRQARLKLDRVEANRIRLEDILGEVKKRLASIRRQATRARLYRERNARFTQLRVALAGREWEGLHRRLGEAREALDHLATERATASAELESRETEILKIEAGVEDLQRRVQEAQVEVLRGEGEIRTLEERITLSMEQAEEIDRQVAASEQRERSIAAVIEERREERADLVRLAGEHGEGLAGRERALDEARTAVEVAETERMQIAERIESGRTRALEIARDLARIENEIAARDREAGHRRERARILAERIAGLGLDDREQVLAGREAEFDAAVRELEGDREAARELRRRIEPTAASESELLAAVAGLRETLGREETRREILEEWEEHLEGISASARRVLEAKAQGHGGLAGVHGTIADRIRVEFALARAVEVALGEDAQALVVDRVDDIWQALGTLQDGEGGGGGGVTFLPLDRARRSTGAGDRTTYPGVLGRAGDLVESSDETRPVLDALLGETWIVEDREVALRCWQNGLGAERVVTLEGEVYDERGLVRTAGTAGSGLVSRRAELEHLTHRIASLRGEIEEKERTLERTKGERARIAEALRCQEEELEAQEAVAARLREERDAVRRERDRVAQERDISERERGQFLVEAERYEREAAGLRETLAHTREERPEDGSPGEEAAALEEADRRLAEARERFSEAQVVWAEARERAGQARSRVEELDREMERLAAEREESATAHARGNARREELRRGIVEAESRIESLRATLTERRELVAGLEERVAEGRTRVRESDSGCDGLRKRVRELDRKYGEAQMAEQECRLKVESTQEGIRDRFGVALSTCRPLPIDEAGWEIRKTEADEIKEKIDRMGPVNLEAIEEEGDLARRASFLDEQEKDLVSASGALTDLIERIDAKSRDLFIETFARVRENFSGMFRRLFGGGKAEVFLEDENDPLESGIEIVARPPGKEPRSITLLSGGEKAMTAVSLLFAVFESRPSPFCILDEVDAPLDETNIDRFVAVLREFLDHSQFLIITHNKRTMRIADRIYGITQKRPGVSTHLTLRFEEAAKVG